ncbi:solute carrier family 22 member 21-like protein [Lasius niger]|uniref:Solute carrier family 22 member 21-like protein n=1 Tax=Lasius niger TaxID=67767 RepID=A0A0J7KGE3_LASNI|nr:solute carrier family 22 member 21-like protein [Lasius niger]
MAGKLCITAAFTTTYVYTAELFPTTLRNTLLGFCSMTGRIGSMLSPQTPLLAQIMPSLPFILFGSMGIIAGILSLILPETLGTKLPDTIWEAENIGRVKSNETREIPGLKSDAKTP